jgi:hypothetical protein
MGKGLHHQQMVLGKVESYEQQNLDPYLTPYIEITLDE